MDVDLCAGGDGTRRKVDLAAVSEAVMEVVPLEMYDSARAKIAANLRWLFAKAYGIDHIPEDLRDPFYTDQYDQEHIKPPVIHLLLSCELFCRVCALILKTEQAASLQSHMSVIQALSRKGIYVMESDDTAVTQEDLAGMPIKMSAHMSMIDALMMAYTVEMISIEKVVASVKRFSTFSASKELPFDLEDAMVFWINKVNMKMKEITEREHKVKHHLLESPSHQKVRYRREHASGRQLPFFPLLEDLMRNVCDGAPLLTVVHFYCPDVMKLEDICLKEVPSIADSLYNIQLLREFAGEYLNKSCYLTAEDLLYSPLVLKHNVMVFIAELFWWFETVKPEFVQPRDLQELKDGRAVAHPKSARPSVPISNATKRSFLAESNAESCTRYFLHHEEPDPLKGGPTFSPSHPLLPLRQRQQKQQGEDGGAARNRSNSLTQMDGKPSRSSASLTDRRQRPLSTLSPFMLHADSDADLASADSVSLARSISKDSLASNVANLTPKHQAQHAAAARRANGHGLFVSAEQQREAESEPGGFYLEPLMPAVLKPAKEKSVCVNKEEESGEAKRGRGSAVRRKAPPSLNQTFSEEENPDAADGFYLHSDGEEAERAPGAEAEPEGLEEEEDEAAKDAAHPRKAGGDEEESAKLQEDLKVKEREDKEGGSGRSSPCLSTCSSLGSVRMTSFAERKAQQQRFGSSHDLRSSASSSQRTTPDGSECSGPLSSSWRLKRDQSPSSPLGRDVLASEIVQLRMQLEEKRRAIEHQKKKMEVLSARQRQKLGKAAFLHIVKKGGGKSEAPKAELNGEAEPNGKEEKETESVAEKKSHGFCLEEELDLNECNRSIELLNEAIGGIQQQMMQLSLQQEMLMKQNVQSPPHAAERNGDAKPGVGFHFVEHVAAPTRKPPKLSSGRSSRSKPSKEQSRQSVRSGQQAGCRSPKNPEETTERAGSGHARGATFRLHDEANVRLPTRVDPASLSSPEQNESADCEGLEAESEETQRSKALIEVDLSDLKPPEEEEATEDGATEEPDGEQKGVMGFFFKDEQKAEDELAKKRAAFLLKQQKKAEEARLRKQQQEAESELKRDEARRKAEEDRIRKEEEKTRRELIKQEYLRRKQQEMFEEQGLEKPRTPKPKQKHKAKPLYREESAVDHFKCSSTPDNLRHVQSGSSLSLASAATNEDSGGAGSQRCDSVESFPGSRNIGRAAERDWDNGSTASSITSMAEYTGPKLFKEPSAKSNKPIIHNAISHCCLAGKVNEPQKNQILEVLEKCESNHLMILFRDGGCQFRALYSYFPDSEEILKVTGTGPKSIGRKMIDKLYKYSSDRKQFTVIPAKTVSVSVDALTIHNHLWQSKRSTVPKKSGK